MPSHIVKIVFRLCITLLFVRCAQVVPLNGGNRDETPPKLLEAQPLNASSNFTAQVITLKFDEFVQLKNLNAQLLVSPSLKTDPEIETDGKKVKIRLKKEELQPNTTYKIYLGKAIADMHEGNAMKDFEYVFSTGPDIDTLKLSGRVVSAFDTEDPGETVVGLYIKDKIASDSFAIKQRPDYITRSEKNGEFRFTYLPAKEYALVAFTDKNKNFTYEKDLERVAFAPESVHPLKDSFPQIRLFSEIPTKLFIKRSGVISAGRIQILYNKKSKFRVNLLKSDSATIYHHMEGRERDTVDLYYHTASDTIHLAVKSLLQERTDTLHLRLPKIKPGKLKTLLLDDNLEGSMLERETKLVLNSKSLLNGTMLRKEKFFLHYKKDSVPVKEAVDLVMTNPLTIEVKNKLQDGIAYRILTDTAAIYDMYGKYNDSLKLDVMVRPVTDLGHLTLNMLFNAKQPYIVQVVDRGMVIAEKFLEFSLSSSNKVKLDFEGVRPGTYSVKVIFDTNENKKWDTGDLVEKRQPEKVFNSSKQIKVMPDWDVEEEIRVN